MLIEHRGKRPNVDVSAFIAPNAIICGDVTMNPQQQAAAMADEGPVLVVAGAGTGKTETLAYRVAHLVCAGVDPGRIMLLTFTRRAAEEMIRRANAIGQVARPETSSHATRVWGGTFHSVANRLLRIYSKAIGLDESFTVLDQGDAEDLMNVVRHENGLSEKDKRFPKARLTSGRSCLPFRVCRGWEPFSCSHSSKYRYHSCCP
jgi:DNA helicase-2/ATP-dependent DNA helicase PcrA